ncbi:Cys/Met metabolism PLP-dependent enzyme-domain-containing protein [Suillus subalutaceus]|uniref:Cys/Met metabolism PLP-dependent enzyme-domain-containing protein n=1 Tax=Suillus subalutaceus TaxID=48586 RepID=UPI001B8789CA|nr:Cys/Met metabolism PLP-dependent enzyme-domain-containing protein [Suillus subalutaceus]KAG1840176.1 Cys/Met metabolism PLP-dependent enzyme-domain-containing protein [Suillus subalutaceus]
MTISISATNGHANGVKHHLKRSQIPTTGAVIPPISLSTTYKQDEVGVHKGFEYSRSGNPNRDALERTLVGLEAGAGHAIAFASGSATTATILQSLGPNAHVLSVNDVYGGTFRYMTRVAKETTGTETTFLDLENAADDEILGAIRENTKLIWIESPTNPTLRLIDIPRIVGLARQAPSKPLVLGADIVIHSLTKYINGHSDVVMGAAIVPSLSTPDRDYDDLVQKLRFLQNAHGAVPSAFDCWLAQRGAKTLAVRMKAHGLNALRVASFLTSHPAVEHVIYPGLASHPLHALARASLSPHTQQFLSTLSASALAHGIPYGGMVSFRLRGGARSAEALLPKLNLFTLAESLGGVESLAELPARMTHASIPAAEREALGIEGLVRLSCGIEEADDLDEDSGCESGLVTPSDVSDDGVGGADGANGLH